MVENVLTIILKPNYYSTAENMGFDIENEEINDDAVLFQQGFETEELEIEPNEIFVIQEDFEATIDNENFEYEVVSIFEGERNVISFYEPQITLHPGKYLFQSNGKTIQFLSSND